MIAIVVSSYQWGLDVARGVQRYAVDHRLWLGELVSISMELALEVGLEKYQLDGAIVQIRESELERRIRETGLRVVNVSSQLRSELPSVTSDNVAVGKIAAEFLMGSGHANFAYFGEGFSSYSRDRETGFCETLGNAGYRVHLYGPRMEARFGNAQLSQASHLADWLMELPKPVAVFSANDLMAAAVCNECAMLGIDVPEQVSALGVDNDPSFRDYSPSLSSVEQPLEQIGYQAAAMLRQIIERGPSAGRHLTIAPTRVIARASTMDKAIHDAEVVQAAKFIRTNAQRNISVDDVVAVSTIGRRALERRFKAVIGHTLKREIDNARMAQVKKLLVSTDLSLDAIADRCQFSAGSNLCNRFVDLTGITPAEYRRTARHDEQPGTSLP